MIRWARVGVLAGVVVVSVAAWALIAFAVLSRQGVVMTALQAWALAHVLR